MGKGLKFIAVFLICALLLPLLPLQTQAAGYYFGDSNFSKIGHLPNDYVATQGMCADENYIYTIKTPSGGHNSAILYRTSMQTGSTVALRNADDSSYVLSGLGHGNDMCCVEYNGKTYIYLTTMYHIGHEEFSAHTIWKLEVSGDTVRKVAYYDITNGGAINFVALALHSFENGVVRLLGSVSTMVFYFDIGINQGSGTVPCTYVGPLNYQDITEPTGAPGYSGYNYGEQGMTYNNGILYFVMSSNDNIAPTNKDMIIGFDLSNLADGSLRQNIQAHTTYVVSSYYWFFFEIESVDCVNGRMYFAANAGSSSGYYNNEDFVGCFSALYDTDPKGMLFEFESGSRETSWNWRHYIATSGSTISPNPTAGNGYLSGTLGALTVDGQTSSDSYVRMTAYDVLYKIKSGDIMEIGFDYEHISGTAPNSAAVFFTTNTVGYFTADRMFASGSHTFTRGRNILQFNLSASSAGAVGEFISQFRIDLFDGGSNDFKAKYAIDYIYIGPPQDSPQNKVTYLGNGDFVFMDFVAASPLSANNNWSGNNVTATVNRSNGTLEGNILGGDPCLCTEGMPGMKIKSKDIMELRIKTSITSGNAGHLELFYATDKAPGYSGDRMFAVPVYATGEYQVAYVTLPDNLVGQVLTNIRIDPVSSGASEPLKGTYTIDYIYAGRPNNSPKNKQEHTGGGRFLLLEFDKESPLCETTDWVTNGCTVTGSPSASVLKGSYKAGDPYASSVGHIRYQMQKGDVVEIRMKSTPTSGVINNVMEFYFVTLNKPNYDGQKYLNSIFQHNGSYQTIRMTLPEAYAGEIFSGIRIDPLQNGAGDALAGSFEIDYIYLGPKDQAPASIYTVQFYDGNGKLLEEQTVSQGDSVTFTGATPTKTSDEQMHYSFNGWVDAEGKTPSLSNIQGDLKLYASFTAENHHYTSAITKEPTCTAEGVETYTCKCGKSFTDPLPKTDHLTELVNAVAPTCSAEGYSGDLVCKHCGTVTQKGEILPAADHDPLTVPGTPSTCNKAGLSDSSYCATCGEILVPQTSLPLAEHSPVPLQGVAPTCVSSGLSDGQKCSVCGKILAEQYPVPRLGHTYTYTDQGETHLGSCIRCKKTLTESHSFTDGSCICGKQEATEPEVDTDILIRHNLNLAGDISINYVVSADSLSSYDSFVLRCYIPFYEGNDYLMDEEVVLQPQLRGSYYYFVLEGMTAVQMNDIVLAQLEMTKKGNTYLSNMDSYSIATYAYAQMRKAESAESLKLLCANLLQYGASAQLYKGYRTDDLAYDDMYFDELLLMTDLSTVAYGNTNEVLRDLTAPKVLWAGKSLDLNSKVNVKFVIDLSTYTGNKEALSLRVRYTDLNGEEQTVILQDLQAYSGRENYYFFTFHSLLAAELRSVLYATVYEGNTPVSQTLTYSPDTYAQNKTGSLLTLCQALLAYSDSAKSYFAG